MEIMAYIGKSPQNGVRTRYTYQATSGQTAFTGSDANSNTLSINDSMYCDVYLNGILLQASEDYSMSSTTMTLVSGASEDDIVEIVVFDVFSVSESYTKTEADNRYTFFGNDSIIRTNGQTISSDITISSTTNGVSTGPISTTATITVSGYWTIV